MKDAIWIAARRVRTADLARLSRLLFQVARLGVGYIKRSPIVDRCRRWSSRYPAALIQVASRKPVVQKWNKLAPVVRWAAVAAAFWVVLPLISVVHETAVLLAALLLNWLSTTPLLEWPVRTVAGDPIYVRLALEMLGNIHTHGLAVSGQIGSLLHGLWPALFVSPALVVEGTWASAVMTSGSSLISQLLVTIAADGLLIVAGVLLVRWGLKKEPLRLALANPSIINGRALFGILLQARAVVAIMSMELTQSDLDNLGLAHIGTKLLSTSQQSYESSLFALSGGLSLGLRVFVTLILYAVALQFARLVFRLLEIKIAWSPPAGEEKQSRRTGASRLLYLLPVAAMALLVSISAPEEMSATNFAYDETMPVNGYAVGRVEAAGSARSEAQSQTKQGPGSSVANPPVPTASLRTSPSVVSITGSGHNYAYLVNGKRKSIRGVGYNVIYRNLPDERRANRYDQDFARMADAGINTILGWDADQGYAHDKFDDLLLSKASKHGLGVLMPYFLDPDGDYSNDEYRARLTKNVVAWVRRFKDRPAVRMWAIGNEVMHGMEAMQVLHGTSPKSNPTDFVDFYLKLADDVHKEDPNHPVLYRTAEDGFLGPFETARRTDAEARPWLAFGMNIFSSRLGKILTNWERHGFDSPLLVSEFGPVGLSAEDRPGGLVKMWRTIRRHRCSVLGGIVYVWTTDGPEPMDRVFGLVDDEGNAVDGSLDAIAGEYRQDSNLPGSCMSSPKGPQ